MKRDDAIMLEMIQVQFSWSMMLEMINLQA